VRPRAEPQRRQPRVGPLRCGLVLPATPRVAGDVIRAGARWARADNVASEPRVGAELVPRADGRDERVHQSDPAARLDDCPRRRLTARHDATHRRPATRTRRVDSVRTSSAYHHHIFVYFLFSFFAGFTLLVVGSGRQA